MTLKYPVLTFIHLTSQTLLLKKKINTDGEKKRTFKMMEVEEHPEEVDLYSLWRGATVKVKLETKTLLGMSEREYDVLSFASRVGFIHQHFIV